MNHVMLSGMVKFMKYTPNQNPDDKWNNARAFFKLVVKKPNAQKLHEEGKPSDDFVNCVAKGKNAEYISRYYPDNSKLVISSGRIETYETVDKTTGQKVYGWHVLIENYLPTYELISDAQLEAAYNTLQERKARKGQAGAPGQMPAYGQNGTPGQMPAYGQNGAPGQMPGYSQAGAPGQMPAYGQAGTPGQMPGYSQAGAPGQMPGYGQAGTPGQMPGYSQAGTPGQMPAYGQTAAPAQNNAPANKPAQQDSSTAAPAQGQNANTGNTAGPVQNGAPQFPGGYGYGSISDNLVISNDDLPF